ncbi:hypothetical protein Sdagh_00170 [Streptomyces daghestanicus]|uniref:NADP-dependent oxidoreductase domain-containing protein n=1 Tax=Streptomyces daghestanicus TaxID=66885 RepID=A0ABQ3PTE4_9ACTN|nr:hypothetical protein Sdagh_00170 [Streptomyces daghestanicus]
MGMSQFYGPADRAGSIATVRLALDLGVNLLDTADVYGAVGAAADTNGFGHNETLLGEAVRGRRDRAVIATKFGARPSDDGRVVYDGTPAYVRSACEASLRRLGTDHIDLYYCHRLDPGVPVEETVGAMAELVTEGKVTALGLSNAGPTSCAARPVPHPSPPCRGSSRPANLPPNLRLGGLWTEAVFARERGATTRPGRPVLGCWARPYAVVPVPGGRTRRSSLQGERRTAARTSPWSR